MRVLHVSLHCLVGILCNLALLCTRNVHTSHLQDNTHLHHPTIILTLNNEDTEINTIHLKLSSYTVTTLRHGFQHEYDALVTSFVAQLVQPQETKNTKWKN